jgi:hypothetical protein
MLLIIGNIELLYYNTFIEPKIDFVFFMVNLKDIEKNGALPFSFRQRIPTYISLIYLGMHMSYVVLRSVLLLVTTSYHDILVRSE